MARVPYIDRSELEPAFQDLLDRPVNIFRALANSPELLRAYMDFGMWIRTSCALDPRLRELVILQIAVSTRNSYEFSHHVKIGAGYGVTADDVRALIDAHAQRPDGLGERERAVVAAAREMAELGVTTDPTWAAVTAHLDDARIVELVMIANFYVAVARTVDTLRIEVEPEYEPFLHAYDFPACLADGVKR